MKLDNKKLHQLFTSKQISFLFHANTVGTSMTFIKENGLMSRGAVEAKGIHQTPQSSDALDKIFNVWNDVFLDTIDLHGYFPRQNLYGPISFQLSTDFLLDYDYNVWVTKDNPINWSNGMTDEQKYFTSVEELAEQWDNYERQRKMITIRNQMEPILFDYVQKVLIDDPGVKIEGNIILANEAAKGLKEAMKTHSTLKSKFKWHECSSCFCRFNYLNQVGVLDLKRLFLPIQN